MSDADEREPQQDSVPIAAPSASPGLPSESPASTSLPRHVATARLASPIPNNAELQDASSRRAATPLQAVAEREPDFKGKAVASSPNKPGDSILTSGLRNVSSSPAPEEPPSRSGSPPSAETGPKFNLTGEENSPRNTPAPTENPQIIRRHLVQPQGNTSEVNNENSSESEDSTVKNPADVDEFSSLQLQGGDITRPVYRWTEEAEAQEASRRRRSFDVPRPEPESATLDIGSIKIPGGFRRDYLRRAAGGAESNGLHSSTGRDGPQLPTRSFLEFLTLYGHFAGEELEEDDEALGPDEYFVPELWREGEEEIGEETALLPPGAPGKHPRRHRDRAPKATNSATGAMLLLLKSFVGTGILFLPRAFLNGGMLFSSVVLVTVSLLSYYCFILLISTRSKIEGSFGDIGGALYGKHMRRIILGSIALSQFGFVSAYTVFVSTNLQAFVLAVSKCKTFISIQFLILMQLIIFLPLSLIRDISKLAFTALIADAFILLGIVYLYGVDIKTIIDQGGVADIKAFNPQSWQLLIGTAIFTYEGVGLIIPIQESMKRPQQFPRVLALCMIVITVIFLSSGVLGYATFGSATETVVLLNLPQDDKFVNGVQFLYSIAILLSTPLQLFPAIRIMENGLFTRSGKYNPGIKWKKNIFRFFLVVICAVVAWGGAADLDKFVALVGSFACVPLVYVYPPLLHWKAVATTRFRRWSDIALAVFGTLVCIYTTILTVHNWVAGSSEPSKPGHCDV
ncbi:amino acid transporter [Coccidioides immitis RS]|uniref:Amino acid transporter n=3 Tax=Coccidioides immitis TaxID=5501 RepID=J3K2P9_COCIM|nr:amino acid transporter [Coccidioides immitis RS]EAS28384.3 amino acid transporter [Coccidioides immitis RS]KMP09237.1 Avt4p [Coccidioides immitis RMSCC 2394]KMU86040.1 Avt4p [Coccidioides immitis H538.4]TPX26431.1 neutral amino acid transporter [Coccidioides immitis]